MPSNVVPSDGPEPVAVAAVVGAPTPAPHTGTGLVTCEACGSRITRATGELFEVGDRIKRARKSEEKIESLESEITRLTSELTAATEAVAALKRTHEPPPPAESKKVGW